MIKLRDWQVFALPPFAATVVGVPHSAVISHEHDLRVGWIDPHDMRIAVSPLKTADHGEAFPAILTDNE